jgi:hypothetical protein
VTGGGGGGGSKPCSCSRPDFSTVISEGCELWGGTGRGEGRGAGRGTADASTGGREDSSFGVVGAGLGVFAGSAFSVRFAFGVGSSESDFFLGDGDLSASAFGFFLPAGVSLGFAFGLGVASSSSPAFFVGDLVALGFGVGDSSSSSSDGVFFGFALGFGVGLAFFFVFAFLLAGFGFAVGSGVSDGVGEVTARISSRAFFFFSSLVDWARTNAPSIAARAKAVPR